MSERNGDKSRFGRERRKKIFQRKRNRELRERLKTTTPLAVNSAKPPLEGPFPRRSTIEDRYDDRNL